MLGPADELRAPRQSHLYHPASRIPAGVIEPMETRQTIALALEVVANAPQRPTRYGVFRM